MKKRNILTLIILCLLCSVKANNFNINEDIKRLEEAISNKPVYESQKRRVIDSLKHASFTAIRPYTYYQKIFEEYKSYNYDTALIYASLMDAEAQRLNDLNAQIEASVAKAFVYLSGGLFKEAYDVLEGLDKGKDMPDEYNFTFARLLWDMSDYAGGEIAIHYDSVAISYIDRLLQNATPADSAHYWYPLAATDLRQHNYPQAIGRLHETLQDSHRTYHERAVYESSLAFAYYQTGQSEAALHHYIEAAIYDIRSCTHETIALRMVAEVLFTQGHMELAERYIRMAMDDAIRYNARHRQVSISQTLPIIEHQQTDELRQQRRIAFVLLGVVVILLIVCMSAIIILISRTRTVHEAQRTIHQMNEHLLEANQLKEEILSTFLASSSQYLTAVEQHQRRVKEDVVQRRYNELMAIPKNVDAHLKRINMTKRLDEMTLRIYPSFVVDFNRLLRPEERFILKPDELLNTPMRIFALMRLGITDNDTIAEILNCSINTVYTYKTRTILRSNLDANAFYAALMSIPSFK